MARNENPPFDRGKTFFEGTTPTAQQITDAAYLLGKQWAFEDLTLATNGTKTLRSGFQVVCRAVRNVSAGALLPMRLVQLDTSGTYVYGTAVSGYAAVNAQYAFPVDEYLVSTGVIKDDIFYIVVDGPAMVLTQLDGGSDNVINIGDRIVASTAATSGATTAGRVKSGDYTGATLPLADNIANVVGRAMSAATTANTNAQLLVMVNDYE